MAKEHSNIQLSSYDDIFGGAEKEAKALQQKMANVEQYVGKDNSRDQEQQQLNTGRNNGRT